MSDRVTLRWAGRQRDGSPATGRLLLSYGGGRMLDGQVAVFPTALPAAVITPGTAPDGQPAGLAQWTVYATNADLPGAGGTYTLTEQLDGLTSTSFTFVADKDAPGGEVWLATAAPVPADPGAPYAPGVASTNATVTNIVRVTAAEYSALEPKDPATLYVIVD